jgi:hypothetical protein
VATNPDYHKLYVKSVAEGNTTSDTGIVPGTWAHVAVVRGEDGSLHIYLDGVQDPSGAAATLELDVSTGITFGTGGSLNTIGIDELRVTRAARYSASFTPPTGTYR